MPRYRARIEFDGRLHCGWQIQDLARESEPAHKTSIQSEIERSLTVALHETSRVEVTGCGRTDAGVSAEEYFFHFDRDTKISDLEKLRHSLNGILPETISMTHLEEAKSDFHALESVQSKTYRYGILFRKAKPSYDRSYLFWVSKRPEEIDLALLKKVAAQMEGDHDFKAFCAAHASTKTTRRTLTRIEIETKTRSGDFALELWIRFTAPGFLKHMVRNLCGMMLDIVENRRNFNDLAILLKENPPDRREAGLCVPAFALVLERVNYR